MTKNHERNERAAGRRRASSPSTTKMVRSNSSSNNRRHYSTHTTPPLPPPTIGAAQAAAMMEREAAAEAMSRQARASTIRAVQELAASSSPSSSSSHRSNLHKSSSSSSLKKDVVNEEYPIYLRRQVSLPVQLRPEVSSASSCLHSNVVGSVKPNKDGANRGRGPVVERKEQTSSFESDTGSAKNGKTPDTASAQTSVDTPPPPEPISRSSFHKWMRSSFNSSTFSIDTRSDRSRVSRLFDSSFLEWMSNVDPIDGPRDERAFGEKISQFMKDIYQRNEVFTLVIIAILLARAYPPIGAKYLFPEVTSTWIAVMLIFVLAGLGLKTEEFSKAFQRFKFNLFVQTFSFGAISSIVFGVTRILIAVGVIGKGLADGMVVCACLPMSNSSTSIFTILSGGDEAAAVFNSAFGNMIAVGLTPVLILAFLGLSDVSDSKNVSNSKRDVFQAFYKLAIRVLLPVLVGQILQKTSPWTVRMHRNYKLAFQKAQLYSAIWIVYTVFCRTFESCDNLKVSDVFTMVLLQFLFFVGFMGLSWMFMVTLFPGDPKLVVMGFFGCTHKTVSMGVPLIGAIYEDDPLVGLYTLPLLVWYPLQLLVGSFLTPRLKAFVERETRRLKRDKLRQQRDMESDTEEEAMGASNSGEPPQMSSPQGYNLSNDQDLHVPEQHGDLERGRGGNARDFVRDAVAEMSEYESDDYGHYTDEKDDTVESIVFYDQDPGLSKRRPGPDSGEGSAPIMHLNPSVVPHRPSSTKRSESRETKKEKKRRHHASCATDHCFFEEGVVFERVTKPGREYLVEAYCVGGCEVHIAAHSKELGILPSETTPVFVCKRCKKHPVCYACWTRPKRLDVGESVWNLYG